MKPPSSQAGPWLALMRISNLPTVISNVLVGGAIALAGSPGFAHALRGEEAGRFAGWLAAVSAAVAMFYVAGMALNDAVDADVDARERPERPIPSGRISRRAATAFAGLMLVGGLAVLAFAGTYALISGLILAATIVAYDLIHQRTVASVVLMGACRGLVYLVAASAVGTWLAGGNAAGWPVNWRVLAPFALAITGYVVLLTIVARAENAPRLGQRRWVAFFIPALVVLAMLAHDHQPAEYWWAALAAGLFFGWMVKAKRHLSAQPPEAKPAVLTYLSGICLVDAFFLTLLEQPILAAVAGLCFVATILAHRRIMGT